MKIRSTAELKLTAGGTVTRSAKRKAITEGRIEKRSGGLTEGVVRSGVRAAGRQGFVTTTAASFRRSGGSVQGGS